MDFDFQRYIQSRRGERSVDGVRTFQDYAFGRDVKVLRTLDRTRFVGLALKATARLERSWLKNEVVDKAVRVGPGAHADVRELAHDVARAVGMATPTIYLTAATRPWLAVAVTVEGSACILLDPVALDTLSNAELSFVLGQQCGHLDNGHLPYTTCQFALAQMEQGFAGWLLRPAQLALETWQRVGDITADRAGLLACRDLEVATSALRKLHPEDTATVEVGVQPVDVAESGDSAESDEFQDQADLDEHDEDREDGPDDTTVVDSDAGTDAPAERRAHALRNRLRALAAFERSSFYRVATGLDGGDPLTDVDKEVEGSLRWV